MLIRILYTYTLMLVLINCLLTVNNTLVAQSHTEPLNNQKADGYKGIWFTLGQFSEFGDKYSGGLGTYTAKHHPLAIYAPEVNKSFFVYGGTTSESEKYLLCMIGSYDHAKRKVSKPTVVHDKQGVDDPHDNPSLLIDPQGYIWVFVSGRGRSRPGFKYKSLKPYSIDAFRQISEEEMTYPQPWHIPDKGFIHLFTKYTGVRELYYETSTDGITWTEDQKLSGIKRASDKNGGHYQMSNRYGDKVATFFNWHPNGDVDQRTNLYYLQTTDLGKTWTTIDSQKVDLPLTDVNAAARVIDYHSHHKNVYLKDVNFDENGNPIGLYISSGGHEPGPSNDPRGWHVMYWNGSAWEDHMIAASDHNYDMGSLFVSNDEWTVIAPTEDSPQRYGGGGEVVVWSSRDKGKTWNKIEQITRQSERNHNYVRRVVSGKAPFHYFWADGNPDEFSQSRLYFGDIEGNVWKLPYTMRRKYVRPKKLK